MTRTRAFSFATILCLTACGTTASPVATDASAQDAPALVDAQLDASADIADVPVVTDAGDANMLTTFDAGVMTATSVAAVSHALIDLMARPDRVNALRVNALDYARNRYTPSTMVNGTMRAYRDVLERSGLGTAVSI